MKQGKCTHIITEIIQWVLIVFSLGMCLYVYPMVREYVKINEKNQQYKQIYYDKTIDNLIGEKEMLMDSLSRVSKDTVYIKKYIRTVDTIYDIRYVDFPTYDEIIREGLLEEN